MTEIQHRKNIEKERDRITKANEELFDEAQRLSDKEDLWVDEKATLEAELVRKIFFIFHIKKLKVLFRQMLPPSWAT